MTEKGKLRTLGFVFIAFIFVSCYFVFDWHNDDSHLKPVNLSKSISLNSFSKNHIKELDVVHSELTSYKDRLKSHLAKIKKVSSEGEGGLKSFGALRNKGVKNMIENNNPNIKVSDFGIPLVSKTSQFIERHGTDGNGVSNGIDTTHLNTHANTYNKEVVTNIHNNNNNNNNYEHETGVGIGNDNKMVVKKSSTNNANNNINISNDENDDSLWANGIKNKLQCLYSSYGGILLFHIRKAAGTSMRDVLEQFTSKKRISMYETEGISLDRRFLTYNTKSQTKSQSQSQSESLRSRKVHSNSNPTSKEFAIDASNGSLLSVITLRDPITRILSLYWYEHVGWFDGIQKNCKKKCATLKEWIDLWRDSST